jgi:hypothetical protein
MKEPPIDRQTLMMITNLIIGALGGLAIAFFVNDVREMRETYTAIAMGSIGFAIIALASQATKFTRIIGAYCALFFFTFGTITAYILVQQMYPGLIPVAFTQEDMQHVVRAAALMVGILVTIAWWKLNPYTPVPAIRLTFLR